MKIVVRGTETLRRRVDALVAFGDGHEIETALTAAAEVLVSGIRMRAPVLTGNLRRSYHVEPSGSQPTAGASVTVGTDVEYAAAQEFGYAPRNLAPQPHVRPAVDEDGMKVGAAFADAFEQLVERGARA